MFCLNYLFSKYLLIVNRFESLRERRYVCVYDYYNIILLLLLASLNEPQSLSPLAPPQDLDQESDEFLASKNGPHSNNDDNNNNNNNNNNNKQDFIHRFKKKK